MSKPSPAPKNGFIGYLSQFKHGVFALMLKNYEKLEFETKDDFQLTNKDSIIYGQSKIVSKTKNQTGEIKKTKIKADIKDTLNKFKKKAPKASDINYLFIFEGSIVGVEKWEVQEIEEENTKKYEWINSIEIITSSNIYGEFEKIIETVNYSGLDSNQSIIYAMSMALEKMNPTNYLELKVELGEIQTRMNPTVKEFEGWFQKNMLNIVMANIPVKRTTFKYFDSFKKYFPDESEAILLYNHYYKFEELVNFLLIRKFTTVGELETTFIKIKGVYLSMKKSGWDETRLIQFLNSKNLNLTIWTKFSDIFEIGSKIYASEKKGKYDWE